MKIPFKGFVPSLRRSKKVVYFNHDYGVLERKAVTKIQMASSVMSGILIFAGVGVVSMKVADLYANHQNQQKPVTLQRQTASVSVPGQSNEDQNKLKDATTKAKEDEQLAKQIKTKLKNVPGGQKWSVYIRDIKSDRMASIDADRTYEAGSLANVFLTLPLEAKTPSANWNAKAGKQTIAKCVQSMIDASDSACASSLSMAANLKAADGVLDTQGFKKTTLEDSKKQQTTPREMGELLYRLQKGQLISDKARRIVFDGLYGHKQREGLPKGCDQNCLAANIAYEGKSLRHDAAIITSGEAQYVVVIMSDNNATWSQFADVSTVVRQAMQP